MSKNTDNITVSKVKPGEFDELLELYIDLFHDREPLTRKIGFSKELMRTIAHKIYAGENVNSLSREELWWVARDQTESNRGVGFIVCDDPSSGGEPKPPENLTKEETAKISAMMKTLEELRSPLKDRISSGPGNCLHISAIGVSPGYEGSGIATRLLQAALSEAERKNFLNAFAECTSIPSRRCHEKLGFTCINSITLNNLEGDGSPPSPEPGLEIYLMLKELNPDASSDPTREGCAT